MQGITQDIGLVGIGLRREQIAELLQRPAEGIGFLELAPENWMGMGGHHRDRLRSVAEAYPLICHGLSLSIGSPAPLDIAFVRAVRRFMDEYKIQLYSEHLSYCSDDGHLYDLLPIPFTEEAVHYVAGRIRMVQDILERPLVIENVSYYAAPGKQMGEAQFVRAVLEEADCQLLLDVNNVYVNSVNHGYDAQAFLAAMPGERIAYYHIAGHLREEDGLVIDTHGMAVVDPVWQLLSATYARFGVRPTLLERDFNIPPLPDLLRETAVIHQLQQPFQTHGHNTQRAAG